MDKYQRGWIDGERNREREARDRKMGMVLVFFCSIWAWMIICYFVFLLVGEKT